MFGPGEFLHGVDQQFAALRIEFELGLIDPNELHAVDVSAVVGLDGIDDHAGVQLEPDLARLDQLIPERRQPIGWLDRYHPDFPGAGLDGGLRRIGGDGATADHDHVAAAREVVRDDVVGAHPKEFHGRDHLGEI